MDRRQFLRGVAMAAASPAVAALPAAAIEDFGSFEVIGGAGGVVGALGESTMHSLQQLQADIMANDSPLYFGCNGNLFFWDGNKWLVA